MAKFIILLLWLIVQLIIKVSNHSIILLEKPEDFEYYGFKCFQSEIPVSCKLQLASTAADLPLSFPEAIRNLNDTNLLYLDYTRYLTNIKFRTVANFTSKVKFEAEFYFVHAGLFSEHIWYGNLDDEGSLGGSYMWFPYQSQYQWLNVTSRDIRAEKMHPSHQVGLSLNRDQYGVFKWIKITLDEPDPPPLICDNVITVDSPSSFINNGFECNIGMRLAITGLYEPTNCELIEASTAIDLPNTFSPEFRKLLANETQMLYFNAPDVDEESQRLEIFMEIPHLYYSHEVRFAIEVFEDPNEDSKWKRAMCGPGTTGINWFFLNETEGDPNGWKRLYGTLNIKDLVYNYKVGFKLRVAHTAVFRKLEIILKPENYSENCTLSSLPNS